MSSRNNSILFLTNYKNSKEYIYLNTRLNEKKHTQQEWIKKK